ncbi:oxidoreductase, 2OG-Fe(II) oxygenase family protein [Teladorsagia circumcincta]|uniref:Oxidoreductase, 2OG-Fe(II) oxygenase family protein n=1 Tax=Teladorsagia circumcincta TaxID=45464 RepID=A0A2G9UYH9_TELCI|nr:oxidoreductase, 2OG-Fe(II) oxygenase family protein [Teladorsagia circumcincta]
MRKLLILALLMVVVVESTSKGGNNKGNKKGDATSKEANTEKNAKNKEMSVKERMNKWFEGKDHWAKNHLELCFKKTPLPEGELQHLKHFDDYGFMKNYVKTYTKRKAISTSIARTSMKGVSKVFRRVQALVPMLNFSTRRWIKINLYTFIKVLRYKKGGHHGPHYDYITYSSPDQYSERTREFGNRFVTFALTLKSPTLGGATTFVLLNHTVTTEPGDAILFTNIKKDMAPSPGSVHAECPVEEGEKITATLWLRPKGQELFSSIPQDEGMSDYDIEKLIAPNMDFYGKSPYYDLYAYQQMMMEDLTQLQMERQAHREV